MTFLARLLKTELIALASLVLLATSIAAYMTYEASQHPFQLFSGAAATRVGFLATLAFGCLPALLLGAPAHAWLAHRGISRWYISIMLGMALGALCFLASPDIGFFGVLFGGPVALVTHWGVARWVSPNNSSKPTPLRGAA